LEDYGASIKYCRKRKSFYYDNDFELTETVFWKKEIEIFFKKKHSVQGLVTHRMHWSEISDQIYQLENGTLVQTN